MSLTREDVLKELELMPIWQLRKPLPQTFPVQSEPLIQEVKLETATPAQTDLAQSAQENVVIEAEVTTTEHATFEAQTNDITTDQADDQAEQGLIDHTAIEASELPADLTLGQGRRASIMQLDWQGLQECVQNCQSCGLAQSRTQAVFGAGDAEADWLIVGDVPSSEDDASGQPFADQSGQLLDNMLAAIQLKRGENVYLSQLLKCRPPMQQAASSEEAAQCEPFLKRQIELMQPKLMLVLGEAAAQALLNSREPLDTLRGKQHFYQNIPVIVTYHPKHLLSNSMDKAKAWEDLCAARLLMSGLQSA